MFTPLSIIMLRCRRSHFPRRLIGLLLVLQVVAIALYDGALVKQDYHRPRLLQSDRPDGTCLAASPQPMDPQPCAEWFGAKDAHHTEDQSPYELRSLWIPVVRPALSAAQSTVCVHG